MGSNLERNTAAKKAIVVNEAVVTFEVVLEKYPEIYFIMREQ